jgi:hypothetical protein
VTLEKAGEGLLMRESSHLVGRSQAAGGECQSGVGSQRGGQGFSGFRYRWGLNRLSSPGARRGRPASWSSFFSRRCAFKGIILRRHFGQDWQKDPDVMAPRLSCINLQRGLLLPR